MALAEDELGQLWIASQSPQLTLFEPSLERFSRLPLKKDGKSVAADDYVVSMLALPGPRLLLSMRRSGMLLLDARTRAFLPLSLPAAARARGLARLADGRLAYALDHRVYLGDSALAEPRLLVELPVGTVPNDLESDPSGGFWLASADSGLYRLGADGAVLQNFRTGSASDSLSDNFCRDLLRDSLGRLWISTSNGLSRLKPDARTFEVWRTRAGDPGSLPGNRISELFEDRSGMLWIGTWTGGPATHDLRTEWLSLIHRVEQDPSSLPSNPSDSSPTFTSE